MYIIDKGYMVITSGVRVERGRIRQQGNMTIPVNVFVVGTNKVYILTQYYYHRKI